MAMISAQTMLVLVSFFHITLAFFLYANPAAINNQPIVFILGQSMKMPPSRGFEAPSQPLAFLAAVLGMLGVSDLVTLSMPEEVWGLFYWGVQAPVRFTFALSLTFYTFFFGPSSPLYGSSQQGTDGADGADGGLKNRVFFTFAFMEMVCWFWVWITLRDERDALVDKTLLAKERKQ